MSDRIKKITDADGKIHSLPYLTAAFFSKKLIGTGAALKFFDGQEPSNDERKYNNSSSPFESSQGTLFGIYFDVEGVKGAAINMASGATPFAVLSSLTAMRNNGRFKVYAGKDVIHDDVLKNAMLPFPSFFNVTIGAADHVGMTSNVDSRDMTEGKAGQASMLRTPHPFKIGEGIRIEVEYPGITVDPALATSFLSCMLIAEEFKA